MKARSLCQESCFIARCMDMDILYYPTKYLVTLLKDRRGRKTVSTTASRDWGGIHVRTVAVRRPPRVRRIFGPDENVDLPHTVELDYSYGLLTGCRFSFSL
jgi:hypothetical protein